MLTSLSKTECMYILNYYNIPIPDDNTKLQILTENTISNNLCKCIQNKRTDNRTKNKIKHKNIKIYI